MCTVRVNRGCPHGHMVITHWAKKSPVESKRASVTYLELRKQQIAVHERPTNCEFTGPFWTVCMEEGLGRFGRSAWRRG